MLRSARRDADDDVPRQLLSGHSARLRRHFNSTVEPGASWRTARSEGGPRGAAGLHTTVTSQRPERQRPRASSYPIVAGS